MDVPTPRMPRIPTPSTPQLPVQRLEYARPEIPTPTLPSFPVQRVEYARSEIPALVQPPPPRIPPRLPGALLPPPPPPPRNPQGLQSPEPPGLPRSGLVPGEPIDVRVVWPTVFPAIVRNLPGQSPVANLSINQPVSQPVSQPKEVYSQQPNIPQRQPEYFQPRPQSSIVAGFNQFDQSVVRPTEQFFHSSMQLGRGVALLTGQNKGMEQMVQTFMKFQAVMDVVKGTGSVVRQLAGGIDKLSSMSLGGNALRNFTSFFGGITESAKAASSATEKVVQSANNVQAATQSMSAARQVASTTSVATGTAGTIVPAGMAGAAGTVGTASAATGATGGVGMAGAGAAIGAAALPTAIVVGAIVAMAAVAVAANVGGSRDLLVSRLAGNDESMASIRRMDASITNHDAYFGRYSHQRHAPMIVGQQTSAAATVRSWNDMLFGEESRLRHAPGQVARFNLERDIPIQQRNLGIAYQQLSRPGSRQTNLVRDIGRVNAEIHRGDMNARRRLDMLGENSVERSMLRERMDRTRGQYEEVNEQLRLHRRAREIRAQLGGNSLAVNTENTFTNAQGYAENHPQWLPPGNPLDVLAPGNLGQRNRAWYGNILRRWSMPGMMFGTMGSSSQQQTQVDAGQYVVPNTNNNQAFQNTQQVVGWVEQQQQAGNANIPQELMEIYNNQQHQQELQAELEEVQGQLNMSAGQGLTPQQGGGIFGSFSNLINEQQQYTALLQRQRELQDQITQQEQQQVTLLRRQREESREVLQNRLEQHRAAADQFRNRAQGLEDQSSNFATTFALWDAPTRQRYMDRVRIIQRGGRLLPDQRDELLGQGGIGAEMLREQARRDAVGVDGQGNMNTAVGRQWAELMNARAPGQLSRNQQIEAYRQASAQHEASAVQIENRIQNTFNVEANSTEIVSRLRELFQQLIQQLTQNTQASISNSMNQLNNGQNTAINGGGD